MQTHGQLPKIKLKDNELKEVKEILHANGKEFQSVHGSPEGAIVLYYSDTPKGKSHGFGLMVDIIKEEFFKKGGV